VQIEDGARASRRVPSPLRRFLKGYAAQYRAIRFAGLVLIIRPRHDFGILTIRPVALGHKLLQCSPMNMAQPMGVVFEVAL
jgi:hypothetical protein